MEGKRVKYKELKEEERNNIEKQLEEHLRNNDKLKIGYYHTLKDIIDKEKGIKTNYLNNHLYYKLK